MNREIDAVWYRKDIVENFYWNAKYFFDFQTDIYAFFAVSFSKIKSLQFFY